MDNSNIVVCQTCGKTLIAEEEFTTHRCKFDVVEIPVSYYYESKDTDKDVVIAKGLNGKLYRLVKNLLPESDHHTKINTPDETHRDSTVYIFVH